MPWQQHHRSKTLSVILVFCWCYWRGAWWCKRSDDDGRSLFLYHYWNFVLQLQLCYSISIESFLVACLLELDEWMETHWSSCVWLRVETGRTKPDNINASLMLLLDVNFGLFQLAIVIRTKTTISMKKMEIVFEQNNKKMKKEAQIQTDFGYAFSNTIFEECISKWFLCCLSTILQLKNWIDWHGWWRMGF